MANNGKVNYFSTNESTKPPPKVKDELKTSRNKGLIKTVETRRIGDRTQAILA